MRIGIGDIKTATSVSVRSRVNRLLSFLPERCALTRRVKVSPLPPRCAPSRPRRQQGRLKQPKLHSLVLAGRGIQKDLAKESQPQISRECEIVVAWPATNALPAGKNFPPIQPVAAPAIPARSGPEFFLFPFPA